MKQYIVNLMLNAPPKVQSQLSQALAIISKADFPDKWESLIEVSRRSCCAVLSLC